MNFEITKSDTSFKRKLCVVLACALALVGMQPCLDSVAGYLGSSVTSGNVTSGNVTSGNVTSGNVTNGNVRFKLNSDGESYCVVDCDTSVRGELIIPDTYKGKPVTCIGDDAFYGCESLTSIIIPDGVISIGDGAFSSCETLTDITIPDSVTSLRYCTFSDCESLATVTIGNGVTSIESWAFKSCTSLVSVTIPDSVTSIVGSAFYDCTKLTSINVTENNPNYSSANGILFNKDKTSLIRYPEGKTEAEYTIPDGVTSIGEGAFYYCDNLTSIIIPDSVITIGESAFACCDNLTSIIIPDSVKTIGGSAFSYCISLTSVTIGDNVTRIGDDAFYWCTGLTSIIIPDSVTIIGEKAFAYCDNLESVTMGNSVTSIGESAFEYCESLTTVIIPDSVTHIGYYAFDGCYSITSVTIGSGVTEVDSLCLGCEGLVSINVSINNPVYSSVDGVLFNKDKTILIRYPRGKEDAEYVIPDSVTSIEYGAFYYCGNPESIIIPDSVTSIDDYAFYSCDNLISIIIPDSVTNMGWYSFSSCDNLTTVIIGEGVTELDYDVFYGCESLTTITIGNAVTNIESNAFAKCKSLVSITIPDSVTRIGDRAFGGCDNLTSIIIPDSVTRIAEEAFANCKSLTSVVIGGGVTSFGENVFGGCNNIKYVFYPGSQSELEDFICIDEHKALMNAVIHYNSTDHSYGDWVIDESATCTQAGSKSHHCLVCDFKSDVTVIEAYGHNYEITSIVDGNSCTVLYKCSSCGETKTELPITGTPTTQIDYEKHIIRTSIQSADDIMDILCVSKNAYVITTPSYVYGDLELYGTGTNVSVYDGDNHIGDFTLVVEGDVDGDSVCDVIDCAQVARVSNGSVDLEGAYALAADSNVDDIVDINDYQSIVNKALV